MKLLKPLFLMVSFTAIFIACKDQPKQNNSDTEILVAEKIEVEGKEVTYSTGNTTMKGYIAFNKNANQKQPGIIVVHEWWGHNDYTRERANMLAELGYTAIAIDMYGDGKQAAHPEDAGKFSSMVMKNIDEAKSRFDAAMQVLKNHPSVDSTKIAAVGYCFGGSVVLTMANAGEDLDAVAAFHSGVQLPIMPNNKLKARVLVANGAADPFLSPESVANFKRAMDSIKADYKYVAYENAKHAFTSKGATTLGEKFNLPLEYNAEADAKSWQALQELLNETFNN